MIKVCFKRKVTFNELCADEIKTILNGLGGQLIYSSMY